VSWSGGCQCGAVRFRVDGELGAAGLCCCRMCQKAFAAPFGALVSVSDDQVTWTRGVRRLFQSSNKVARGFCEACGAPLTFEPGGGIIDLAICAFDRAAEIAPTSRLRADAALPWAAHLDELPSRTAASEPRIAAHDAAVVSFQHPDHDTADWPPDAGSRG
jgi:hypothetical protein